MELSSSQLPLILIAYLFQVKPIVMLEVGQEVVQAVDVVLGGSGQVVQGRLHLVMMLLLTMKMVMMMVVLMMTVMHGVIDCNIN